MAPKPAVQRGKDEKAGDEEVTTGGLDIFDPIYVAGNDRFVFNISRKDADNVKKYFEVILGMRVTCSFEGRKCHFAEWVFMYKCGERVDYRDGHLFIILRLAIDKEHMIELLIFKPNFYMVGVYRSGEWWRVRDFTRITNMLFPKSKTLYYVSNYKDIPKKFNLQTLCNCIIGLYEGDANMSGTDDFFKPLCVIFPESVRYNEILYLIAPTLSSFLKPAVCLGDFHEYLINNWDYLSLLWVVYDIGYIWNPTGEEEVLHYIANGDVACKSLGLLKYPNTKRFLDFLKKVWVKEESLKQEVDKKETIRERRFEARDMKIIEEVRDRELREQVEKVEGQRKKGNIKAKTWELYSFVEEMKNGLQS
ncbi:hypothetical protein OROMI_028977 [Orobanche minor]